MDERTALVVIDMQGGFLSPASAQYIDGAAATVPACAAMKTTIMGDLPAFDRNDIRRIIDQHLRPDGQSEMNR